MSVFPSVEVLAALEDAARRRGMPVKLLEAIAFVESSFNPKAVGPATKSGEHAQGLMQLMPKIQKRYGVTDPFDPKQSADGAAQLLANLAKPLQWNVDEMLAAYNWGVGNLSQAKQAGKTWPKEVLDYVHKVKNARYAYEGFAAPVDGSQLTKLDAAIRSLARINQGNALATALLASWEPYYAQHKSTTLVPAKVYWEGYQRAFERAPLTDSTTPAPFRLSPDLAVQANAIIDEGKKKAGDMMDNVADAFEAVKRIGAELPGIAAMVVLALFITRRR